MILKFKVGDRVICINEGADRIPGTITRTQNTDYGCPYRVLWDDPIEGDEERTFGYDEDELELVV